MKLTGKLAKVGASMLAVLVAVTVFGAVRPRVAAQALGTEG